MCKVPLFRKQQAFSASTASSSVIASGSGGGSGVGRDMRKVQ